MLGLHNLKPAKGAVKNKKRIGRGPGSGTGKTAGKGHKGQKSRSGYSLRPGFEGGQMPLQRRLPKRGFTNIFKKEWVELNLLTIEKRFDAGADITPEFLVEAGYCSKRAIETGAGLVIMGKGEVTKAFRVSAHRITKGAREKIEKAGGSVTILGAAEASAS
ncbi:MAG: 50S ribosomal protein L15 [Acidobacteria bacterium]|nr:50S ribosomal protein L15 [Acidobacteriota bacterium]